VDQARLAGLEHRERLAQQLLAFAHDAERAQ
jgi:hypothetical protein